MVNDDGSHAHHDISREDLMRPFEPSVGEKYILPFFGAIFDGPVTFFREQVVNRLHKPYPYYHRRYSRVPTIEQCKLDDMACYYEANSQYYRDRLVDTNILRILRTRRDHCARWYQHEKEDVDRFCKEMITEHDEAAVNYFIKYGELSWNTNVIHALMKQKHRMLWERRHGPVGQGQRGAIDVQRAVEEADKAAEKEDNMFTIMRRSVGLSTLPKEMRP